MENKKILESLALIDITGKGILSTHTKRKLTQTQDQKVQLARQTCLVPQFQHFKLCFKTLL